MFSRFTNLFNRKSSGVGLEITPERINIAQLSMQGQNYKLKKFANASIPEGIFEEGKIVESPALAEMIQDLLNENKITTKQVATAVPMREAIIRMLPVPAELDEQELRDMVLNHEAALYLPYPREEVDLDYQPFPSDVEMIKQVKDLYSSDLHRIGIEKKILSFE